MKTPRAACLILLVLAASAAHADDPTSIIPQAGQVGITDYSRPQQSRAWKILHIERADSTPSEPSVRINPFDKVFLIPTRNYDASFGVTPLLSVSDKPYPGATKGKPVRLLDSNEQPTGPKLWLSSRRNDDILEESKRWPADTSRNDPLAFIRSPLDSKTLLGKFLSPPGSPALYPFSPRKEPPTFYSAVTNYRYDAGRKKVIDAEGHKVTFTVSDLPNDSGGFYLTPPAIPADFNFGDLTFADAEGEPVDVKKGAVPEEPAAAKKPEAPRSLRKLNTARGWKGEVTAIGEWHAIGTAAILMPPLPAQTFYCYHEQMNGDSTLEEHLKKNPVIVECVDWSIPEDDATQGSADKRYKIRNYHLQFDLAYKEGKLTTINSALSLTVTGRPLSSAAIGGAQFVKVTNAQSPATPGSILLSAKEQTWLDKRQAAEYASDKTAATGKADAITALARKYRTLVVENLAPNAAASAAYTSAIAAAGATPQTIDAALPAEVWGGSNSAVVGLFGDRADIQLSKADWDVLSKNPPAKPEYQAALEAYKTARAGADGRGAGADFTRSMYDPIVLHRTAEAARKLLAPPPATAPAPNDAHGSLLTAAEKQLLTPGELATYHSILRSAKDDPNDPSLQRYVAQLRKRIDVERRQDDPPYAVPIDRAAFDKLPKWQKRKFCGTSAASANPAEDTRAAELRGGSTARADLEASAAASATSGNTATADAPATTWVADACRPYRTPIVVSRPDAKPTVTAETPPPPLGVDKDAGAKKPSNWLNADVVTSAVKGAMIGLLVGSLFGPPGLIAGPLIGAGLFYGLTVFANWK